MVLIVILGALILTLIQSHQIWAQSKEDLEKLAIEKSTGPYHHKVQPGSTGMPSIMPGPMLRMDPDSQSFQGHPSETRQQLITLQQELQQTHQDMARVEQELGQARMGGKRPSLRAVPQGASPSWKPYGSAAGPKIQGSQMSPEVYERYLMWKRGMLMGKMLRIQRQIRELQELEQGRAN